MAPQTLVCIYVHQSPPARCNLAVSLFSSSINGNHVNFSICDMFCGM